ncbi:MAG: hypothetical protein K6B73_08305 [Treponema sp.]|nr:hypothetical protein [Treponema sp.]
MLIGGIILLILGIVGKIFSSVTHITDSTAKAMGWTALNKIVGILSWLFMVAGGFLIVMYLLE